MVARKEAGSPRSPNQCKKYPGLSHIDSEHSSIVIYRKEMVEWSIDHSLSQYCSKVPVGTKKAISETGTLGWRCVKLLTFVTFIQERQERKQGVEWRGGMVEGWKVGKSDLGWTATQATCSLHGGGRGACCHLCCLSISGQRRKQWRLAIREMREC